MWRCALALVCVLGLAAAGCQTHWASNGGAANPPADVYAGPGNDANPGPPGFRIEPRRGVIGF